ncbi:MAG: hypothetical protein RL238_3671 [Actinomycetota bacterium]
MNVGLLLLGLVAGAAIGFGLEAQARSTHGRRTRLQREGERRTGSITAIDAVGKYESHRRITVAVDGSSFVETVPFLEAEQADWQVGGTVPVRVLPSEPTSSGIDRGETTPAAPSHAGRWVGVFIVVLGLVAALIV